MALKDRIPFGMSLPHRSPDPIDMAAVRTVAQRAEALGFRDLWVTENTLDHVTCFDPVVVLTYAAAVTSRIRLGASVVVLAIHSPMMVAHQWATLDHVSNGRAILGVGPGARASLSAVRGAGGGAGAPVPRGGRADPGAVDAAEGDLSRAVLSVGGCDDGAQAGADAALPIWMGVGHPDAVRRAASMADGWMGSGGSSIAEFGRSVPVLREALEKAGRDPDGVSDLETDLHGGG